MNILGANFVAISKERSVTNFCHKGPSGESIGAGLINILNLLDI